MWYVVLTNGETVLLGSESVDFSGQREIFISQPAGVVRGEREFDLVPTNVDVRMVTGLFGELGNGIHEFDCRRKVFELERSGDGFTRALPTRSHGEGRFDLRCR